MHAVSLVAPHPLAPRIPAPMRMGVALPDRETKSHLHLEEGRRGVPGAKLSAGPQKIGREDAREFVYKLTPRIIVPKRFLWKTLPILHYR